MTVTPGGRSRSGSRPPANRSRSPCKVALTARGSRAAGARVRFGHTAFYRSEAIDRLPTRKTARAKPATLRPPLTRAPTPTPVAVTLPEPPAAAVADGGDDEFGEERTDIGLP